MAALSDDNALPTVRLPSVTAAADSRLLGFDALRAFAAVLVVMAHAAVPYMHDNVPGLLWLTTHRDSHDSIDSGFWLIKGFVMPLFLFVAGYFAAGLLARKSTYDFLRHRVRRVLCPLSVAAVTILPFDLFVWLLGFVAAGRIPVGKLLHPKFEANISSEAAIDAHFWGLSHLWFLQYLFLYCILLAVVAGTTRGLSRLFRRSERTTTSVFANKVFTAISIATLLTMMAVSSAVLVIAPEVVIGFQHGFIPFLWKFVYSGLFFFAGALFCGRRLQLDALGRTYPFTLLAAALVAVVAIPIVHRHLAADLFGDARVILAVLLASFAWLSVCGLVGLFLTSCSRPAPIVREVAEASFWIYLIHHPLVGLTQIAVDGLPIHVGWKFVTVTVSALAVSMLLYRVAVRNTWIGSLLNGRMTPPIDRPTTLPISPPDGLQPAAPTPVRRAA